LSDFPPLSLEWGFGKGFTKFCQSISEHTLLCTLSDTEIMTVIIAGDRSNSGKTTITLAILSYLRKHGEKVQSFKVGPDYIDPMFHTKITDRACRNLDPILTSTNYVKTCFARQLHGVNYALIEGVMGLFDGIGYSEAPPHVETIPHCPAVASTAYLARALEIPVILVIDCASLSGSVAAIAQGYRDLDPHLNLAGVILNRVGSARHLELLESALARIDLPILGVLYRDQDLVLPERHLGLVPTDELPELAQFFERLAYLVKDWDWVTLFPLLTVEKNREYSAITIEPSASVNIAIARDRAFNFYYADNLDLLSAAGAELIPWSPLTEKFPDEAQGVYLGGGFPELFAAELADNLPGKQSLLEAIHKGLPTYAECGGLMVLCRELTTFSGETYPMLNLFPVTVTMSKKLTLGYRGAIAQNSTFLWSKAEQAWGHEFHRSVLSATSRDPIWHSQGLAHTAQPYPEGWHQPHIHASYLHQHWGITPHIATRFVHAAARWQRQDKH
jgi:cobyrinic acid a,c-diamide synthase